MSETESQMDRGFVELIECLKETAPPLQRIFLDKKIGQYNVSVKLNELAELAKESYFATYNNPKGVDKDNDPFYSIDSFRCDSLHAVTGLQNKIIDLAKRGKNDEGYMLVLLDDDIVQWEKLPEGIKQFLENPTSA